MNAAGSVLLLGGTGEARALAAELVSRGVEVVSSLAGRVVDPKLPEGAVRVGGFGGVEGLSAYLRAHRITHVVDATHPFAAGISANAAAASGATGVPLLRLARPGWAEAPGAEQWHWVDSHAEAARVAGVLGRRPLLTVGRQSLGEFVAPLHDHAVVARVVDEPDVVLPPPWTLLRSRGPYSLAGELLLLDAHRCDVVVTKDSGGSYTWPKLAAAAQRALPVVVVRRPPAPAGVATVESVDAALTWLSATGTGAGG